MQQGLPGVGDQFAADPDPDPPRRRLSQRPPRPLPGQRGQPLTHIAAGRDVAGRDAAGQSLAHAEKLALLARILELVYGASCRRRHWSGLVRPLFGEAGASWSQTNSLIPIARSARRS